MSFVLISTPVYQREWILPDYLKCIENQDFPLKNIGFQFEAAPDDDASINILLDFHGRHPELRCFDLMINHKESHTSHPEGARAWNRERYAVMANFRNNLLARAKCRAPDRLFSLDTDILIEDPATISILYQLTANLDAVSPLCFMTPTDMDFPNFMTWGAMGMGYRKSVYPIGSVFQADVIMAAVMMSKKAYETTQYSYHRQGEDLGWALDCKTKGIDLYSASSIYAPHIMSRAMLIHHKQHGDDRKAQLEQQIMENIS